MRFLAILLLLPLAQVIAAGCGSSDTPQVIAPQCDDMEIDGTETDVDCGGQECPPCPADRRCLANADCETGNCLVGVCRPPGSAPTCTDKTLNGDETDIDCGGPDCPGCAAGGKCLLARDCASAMCTNGQCGGAGPSCSDGVLNGDETDVDCGGSCPPCGDGMACVVNSDCASAICTMDSCIDVTSACSDHSMDGTETDIDCGGDLCAPCASGKMCVHSSDCQSQLCSNNICG